MTDSYGDVIELVGILAHMREPYDNHGARVGLLVSKLASEMDFTEEEEKQIEIGARLHDLGKLLLRPELVNLPRKLTSAERAEMQNHTNLGWVAIKRAGYSQIIQDIVHHHHEAWDGSGYPIGLQEDFIPLASRVVTICDVYEALTSRRPYREAFSHEYAKTHIEALKGREFDPQIVDLFFSKVAVVAEPVVAE